MEEQVQLLKIDKENIFSLAQQVMACKPPAHSYAIFLHEKILLFCLESIYKEIWYEIEDSIQFLRILKIHDVIGQHLMCELYMHGYYLKHDQYLTLFH